jgi:hypothetical protein
MRKTESTTRSAARMPRSRQPDHETAAVGTMVMLGEWPLPVAGGAGQRCGWPGRCSRLVPEADTEHVGGLAEFRCVDRYSINVSQLGVERERFP